MGQHSKPEDLKPEPVTRSDPFSQPVAPRPTPPPAPPRPAPTPPVPRPPITKPPVTVELPEPEAAPLTVQQPQATGEMWTAQFWRESAERAVKAFIQGMLVSFGLVEGVGHTQLVVHGQPFLDALVMGAAMAFLSVCLSLISNPIGDKGSASAIKRRR